jgi:hypothetical protein
LHNNCRICSVHFEHVFRISRKNFRVCPFMDIIVYRLINRWLLFVLWRPISINFEFDWAFNGVYQSYNSYTMVNICEDSAWIWIMNMNIKYLTKLNKLFVCLHGDKTYNSFVCGNTT